MKWTSEAQMPVLSVRSSSSPAPGTGSGVSRTSSRPPRNTTARMRLLPGEVGETHHRVAAAGDLPAVGGAHDLVVVEADGVDAALIAGRHEHGVDVAARGDSA